jgi:hypothetical protein
MSSLVHTYELLQLHSTDLNGIKPQVNGRERHRRESLSRVSSSCFWEQAETTRSVHLRTSTSADCGCSMGIEAAPGTRSQP